MSDSESVRAARHEDGEAAAKTNGRAAIRKYSRDQLFELAQTIDGFQPLRAELEAMRSADWTKYELDLVPDERLAAAANFGLSRQNSELAGEQEGGRAAGGGGGQHRKLYRMTSSPSIRPSARGGEHEAPVSSQARAKYARLIETMSNGPPAQFNGRQAAPVARPAGQSGAAAAERPGHLFGPLRRLPQEAGGRRRNSIEEPMSLPYAINIASNNRGAEDEDEERPIKRIGASAGSGAAMDEDDFDITSLLSITVLSDIRTIRQDLHAFGRQTSGLVGRPAGAGALSRSKSHEAGARMPARSRTALDFHYAPPDGHERRARGQHEPAASLAYRGEAGKPAARLAAGQPRPPPPQQQLQHSQYFGRHSGQALNAAAAASCTYQTESLPYDWRARPAAAASTLFVPAEMAPPLARPPPPAARKPLDASVAKIIESFKAQVLARASGQAPTSGAPLEVGSKSPGEQINDSQANESRSSCGGGGGRAAQSPARAEPETGTPAEKRLPEQVGALTAATAAAAARQAGERVATSAPRASNIPRLIALQRVKSNQDAPAAAAKVTVGAQDAQADAKGVAGAAGAAHVRPAGGGGGGNAKFVSQYKTLRGKSLADEVAEEFK